MSSRDAILDAIRDSIDRSRRRTDGDRTVQERLTRHPLGVLPQVPADREGLTGLFIERARTAAASGEVVRREDIAPRVAQWLRQHNLAKQLRTGSDVRLSGCDWVSNGLDITTGPSDGADLNGLSHALAGVAETGTLVLASGQDNPTTLNFLPENHIVLIEASAIEGNLEGAMAQVRNRFGAGIMPRTINLVTGPSRSADIEQTLILGAHGPVRLHIMVVED